MRPVPALPLPVQAPPGPGQGAGTSPGRTARFDLILLKVSQNGIVSPKKLEKACHSPYIQNGPQNSPLGILRIPFSAAFSHKELMGHFCRVADFIVKMTKCRRDVHTCTQPCAREVCACCMSQISLWSIFLRHAWSHAWRGILNASVFNRFTGDYD